MNFKIINEEVLYAIDSIVAVSPEDIEHLKERRTGNRRRRVRLCTHTSVDNPLHEMLIVHERGTYVRPHRHVGKAESYHVIEGMADLVFFDDNGEVINTVTIGQYPVGPNFFCRIPDNSYHTLLIHSEILVFHETTTGPFHRADILFAPWAPAEDDLAGQELFLARLSTLTRDSSASR